MEKDEMALSRIRSVLDGARTLQLLEDEPVKVRFGDLQYLLASLEPQAGVVEALREALERIVERVESGLTVDVTLIIAAKNTLAAIAALTPSEQPQAGMDAYKRVYLAGHSEGWRGNQMRRDVQHVDAEKGWNLYVENGALEKAALTPSEQGSGLREEGYRAAISAVRSWIGHGLSKSTDGRLEAVAQDLENNMIDALSIGGFGR